MPKDKISLLVDNKILTGWKSVSVTRSLDALADTYQFNMLDVWSPENTPLIPDKEIKIYVDRDIFVSQLQTLVLTGYIDSQAIKVGTNTNNISLKGRSKTGDLVDCSAEMLPSNSWNRVQFSTIVRDLLFDYDIDLDFISGNAVGKDVALDLSINSGESIFEIISRVSKKLGILPVTNPNGNLEFITTGDRRSQDKLIFGNGLKNVSGEFDYTDRFSSYTIKGQKSGGGGGWKKSTNEISSNAQDEVFGSRYRRKIISLDSKATIKDAQNQVRWEAQIRAGKSGSVDIVLPSWFQNNNEIWEVGTLVYTEIPPLDIAEELLIKDVTLEQTSGGSSAGLKLVNKDTYTKDPSENVKITKQSKKKGFGFGW